MKVAFFTYPAAFQNVGGGEILLLKLKEYLEKEGVKVDLFDSWRSRIEDYDWLHVFGSVKDCLGLVNVARARKVRVAITPLLWSDVRRAFFTHGSLLTKADFLARHWTKWLFPAFPSARRKLLTASDLIFPNSRAERDQTSRLFAVPASKMRVVPNGVDTSFLDADPAAAKKAFGSEPFILGVGRIEPRKNQLNLIRAVNQIPGKKLVLIGSPVSGAEMYFEACRKEGAGRVRFVPTLSHDDPLLKSAYAACEIFVLQGWFETPGLVALEAALAGARVVVTSGGSTREYFGDYVLYLNPADPEDIRKKITASLSIPPRGALKDHVLKNFTWGEVARLTKRFYEE
ncbi:MAG: glycosyltransferase [Candidatus Omnitrophica bacterium]|nr:glycosyltransferase [Candidatus Omnitrophota bacterium]